MFRKLILLCVFVMPVAFAADMQITKLINNYIDSSLAKSESELETYKPDFDKFESSFSRYNSCESCDACCESSVEEEPANLPKVYQHYEYDEQFELHTIRKHVNRLHGAFSTGVLYSDYTKNSYMINRFSLGWNVNKYLSVYIQVNDIEGL